MSSPSLLDDSDAVDLPLPLQCAAYRLVVLVVLAAYRLVVLSLGAWRYVGHRVSAVTVRMRFCPPRASLTRSTATDNAMDRRRYVGQVPTVVVRCAEEVLGQRVQNVDAMDALVETDRNVELYQLVQVVHAGVHTVATSLYKLGAGMRSGSSSVSTNSHS